jgi:cytochrome c oxidase cbb3-type subunit 3
MFDSSVFTSQFWEWFIIVPTVGGIIACFALIWWLGGDTGKPEEDGNVETMGHVWDETLEEYNNPLPRWWLNLFYICLWVSVVYLILYPGLGSFAGILGWNELKQYEQEMEAAENRYGPIYAKYSKEAIPDLAQNPDAVKLGHRLYMTYCTVCHGSDAGGVKGYPNLRDDDWLYGGDPSLIKTTIMNGRQGMMPTAMQNGLTTDVDINNVVQYVLSLSVNEYDKTAAAEGQKTFQRICFACHGMDGKGTQALGAPNLTDNIWLYGGSAETIKETIANGRQGRMPAHGEFLGESKVHLLATYIYGLSADKP